MGKPLIICCKENLRIVFTLRSAAVVIDLPKGVTKYWSDVQLPQGVGFVWKIVNKRT